MLKGYIGAAIGWSLIIGCTAVAFKAANVIGDKVGETLGKHFEKKSKKQPKLEVVK